MKAGKVQVGAPDRLSLCTITQGSDYLQGKLQTSQDKRYSVIFSDGYGEVKESTRKWVSGKVCLIESDNLFWVKEFERPTNAVVSDNGIVAILHTRHREYSKFTSAPREFVDLGGTLTVIEKSGEQTFTHDFGSNVMGCAISSDGILVSVATLAPDDSIYCFHPQEKRMSWKYKNHARKRVLGLEFNGEQLEVFAGGTLAAADKEYALRTNGTLTPEYGRQLEPLTKIKKQIPQEKIESLLAMVKSDNRHEVIEGLSELKSFVYTKGSVPHYSRIADALGSRLQAEDDVFEPLWKVLRVILKKKPEMINPIVPEILSRLKNKQGKDATGILIILGELGEANPIWVKNEQPFIMQKLRSKEWNERRFAAFASGFIGSADPSTVKEAIPLLMEYAAYPERVSKEFQDLAKEDRQVAIGLSVAGSMGVDPGTWLRDACIDALGMIGKKFPESVKPAIPLLEKLSKDGPSPYTIRKAARALEFIRGKK